MVMLRLFLWLSLLGSSLVRADPVVLTDSGPLRGVTTGNVVKYLGIPYAAPPVGELRWKPPQAPRSWTALRDAIELGGACPQSAAVGEFGAPSSTEDCLYLNVAAPARRASQDQLPVMLWIPGGGLFAGASNPYDPTSLVDIGKVVVVTMNYRLGILGFFAHPDIDVEDHAPHNYGFLDQQFALRWVRRNIAAFGGDSNNVTLFGESAGAVSIYGHLVSPASAGLFHKAILESGLTTLPKPNLVLPLAGATDLGRRFAAAAGCGEDVPACLRRLPPERVVELQMPFLSGLIIGGPSVPRSFDTAFTDGQFGRVPVINGTNHDEWRWPIARTELRSGRPLAAVQYGAALSDFFGSSAPKVEAEYSLGRFGSPSEALAAAETDAYFACAALRADEQLSRHVPVYAYEFNHSTAPMYMPAVSFPYGASHTIELQFLFDRFHGGSGTPHTLDAGERDLSARMIHYWTQFAKTGDPNQKGLPVWPRFAVPDRPVLSLDVSETPPRLSSFADDHRCAFWDRLLR